MNRKTLLIAVIASVLLVGIAVSFIAGRQQTAKEQASEQPVRAPSRLTTGAEGPEVQLDEAEQNAADLAVLALTATHQTAMRPAFAEVLDPAPLVAAIAQLKRLDAEMGKAAAARQAARKAAERSHRLHDDNSNVSDQALEAAEVAQRTEEANWTALAAELDSALAGLRLTYGQSVVDSATTHTGPVARLLSTKASLIRISLPPAEPGVAASELPSSIPLLWEQSRYSSQVLGPAPQLNDNLQGPAVVAISDRVLPIGLKLAAQWPQGAPQDGVVVPASAVVWWQGVPWVYRELSRGHFRRELLATPEAAPDGWFVRDGFSAGMRVVVRGAQLLLSEELRSTIKVGEDGE